MTDWNDLCRRAYKTAQKRGQDDALTHCAGEVVEAANARAAYLRGFCRILGGEKTVENCATCENDCGRQWFKDELADIAICVLSKWGECLKSRKFVFPQCIVGRNLDKDKLKNCAMAVADACKADDMTILTQWLGCVFYWAQKEFEANFPDGDFGAAIEAKMAENEKRVEK